MTQFCRIVLTLVSCSMNPQGARPSPEAAAAVLVASVPPAAPAWRLDALGDSLDFNDYDRALPPQTYDPTWPFRTTTPPTFSPYRTRLDGSSVFDPPTVYGLPTYGYGYGGHYPPVYDGYHFAPAVPNGYGSSRRVHPGVGGAGRGGAEVRNMGGAGPLRTDPAVRAAGADRPAGSTVSTTALGAGRAYPRPIQPTPRAPRR